MGKLPTERVTPNHTGTVFPRVGIDCAEPVKITYGSVRRSTVVKAYICVSCLYPSKRKWFQI